MKEMTIGGHAVLYDEEDADYLEAANWQLSKGYAKTRITVGPKDRRVFYMHRLIMRAPDGMHVHHINGNRLDNRRANLQLLTAMAHKNEHVRAQANGVHVMPDGRWRARSRINGIQYSLGVYDDKETALRVSALARVQLSTATPDGAARIIANIRYNHIM